jgi:hypothetical protein
MAEQTIFQRPETVPVHAEVKDWGVPPVYIDPTTITITITTKTGVAVITDVAMTKESLGKYVYYYRPAVDAYLGWYIVKATVVDGAGGTAITTIQPGGFKLE